MVEVDVVDLYKFYRLDVVIFLVVVVFDYYCQNFVIYLVGFFRSRDK